MADKLSGLGEECATLWVAMSTNLGRVPAALVRHFFETWHALRTLESEFGENRLSVETGDQRLAVIREEFTKIKSEFDGLGIPTPAVAPEVTPEVTPAVAPEVTPEVTPEVAPATAPETATVAIPPAPPLTPLMQSQERVKDSLREAIESPTVPAELAPSLSRLISDADTADAVKLDLMKTYAEAVLANDTDSIKRVGSVLGLGAPPTVFEPVLPTPATLSPAMSTIHPRLMSGAASTLVLGERAISQLSETTRALSLERNDAPTPENFKGGCALATEIDAAIEAQQTLSARLLPAVNGLKRAFAAYQQKTAGVAFVSDAEFRELAPRTESFSVQAGGGEEVIQLKKRIDANVAEIREAAVTVPTLVANTASLRSRLQTLRQTPRLPVPEPCGTPAPAPAPVPAPPPPPAPFVSTATLPTAAVPIEPVGTFSVENPLSPSKLRAMRLPSVAPPVVTPAVATGRTLNPFGSPPAVATGRTLNPFGSPPAVATGRTLNPFGSPPADEPGAGTGLVPPPETPAGKWASARPFPQRQTPSTPPTMTLQDFDDQTPTPQAVVPPIEFKTKLPSFGTTIGSPLPGATGPIAAGTPGLGELARGFTSPVPSSRAGTVRAPKKGGRRTLRKKRLTVHRDKKTNVRGPRRG